MDEFHDAQVEARHDGSFAYLLSSKIRVTLYKRILYVSQNYYYRDPQKHSKFLLDLSMTNMPFTWLWCSTYSCPEYLILIRVV